MTILLIPLLVIGGFFAIVGSVGVRSEDRFQAAMSIVVTAPGAYVLSVAIYELAIVA